MRKKNGRNQVEDRNEEAGDGDTAIQVWNKWKQAWAATHIANKAVAIATAVAALAAVVYAIVACYQLSAINEANRFNRESLVSVQRAFVTFTDVNGDRDLNAKWSFAILVENSGTTPAIDVISFSGADDLVSEPIGDTFSGNSSKIARNAIVIGPKSKKSIALISKSDAFMFGEGFDVKAPIVPQIFPGGKSPFLWSWIVYRDVFPNTKPHLTEYCTQIVGTQVDRDSLPDHPVFRSSISNCSHHNCADERCDDYDRVVSLAYEKNP